MSKSLTSIIHFVEKEVKGAEVKVANDPSLQPRRLPFGIDGLDAILGGGLPYGRTTLIKGDFSSGKTFLTQKAIVAAQEKQLSCAFIDVEKGIDPSWFALTGVDLEQLIVTQPGSGEEALDTAIALVKAETDLIILDSVAALVPTAEVAEGMDQQYVGVLARLFNKGLRKITTENRNKSIFIVVNQVRTGIGPAPFPTEALPAGKGQWFFSSIVLDVNRGPWIKEDNKRVGFQMRVRTEKNKLAAPQQECVLPFIFEGGMIDLLQGLLSLSLDLKIIQQRGAIYEHSLFPEGKLRGKLAVLDFLRENQGAVDSLKEKIREAGTR